MAQKQWVFAPDSGGKKIPDSKKREVTQRIEKYAAENYAGKYVRLDIRFRGQFCYIDAYTEPFIADGWPSADWPETREEMPKDMNDENKVGQQLQAAAEAYDPDEVGGLLLPLIDQLFADAGVSYQRTNARGRGYSMADEIIYEYVQWYDMPWES